MKDLALNNPANIREEINKLKEQQRTINTKRLHLLDTLRDVKPPASTKNAVAQWKSAMITVTKRIASLHNKYLRRLYEEYDHAYDACLNEMSEHQELLATEGICKKEEIYIIIKNNFLPLLDERQQRYRQEMRAIENHFHDLLPTQEEQIMKVFQFVQGIAHIWDGHETALINRETALKEKEASLDILLDRMRQDYSEESLQRNLNKCYEFLEEVRQGYIEFQQEQKSIVKNYTQIIENELKKYEDNVLKYFGLIRHKPDIQQFGDDEDAITIKKRRRRPSKRGREEKILPDSVIEALSLSNGKTFYIVTSPHQHGFNPESSVFSLQPPADVDANQNEIRDYSENIAIKNSFILSLKAFVRKTFLEHMMAWREQAMERANNVVTSKVKELDSELELRLHLHGPRTSRIEYDVHNVRASELLLHRERLREHVTAVTRSLTKERAKVTDLSATHQVDVDQFLHVIEAFEPKLTSARKTAHLVAIEVDVQDQLDSFIHGIRSSIREFRRLLDDRLTELRDSNAKFLKSFKLFSEGGNFCPDEVNEFRKKLEKLSRKIDKEEGLILADLEGMETKRLENANEIASKFLDKSKHHLYDLTYIEKVARLITNTEVKIKAEVADSNSQSQKLVKYLDQLEKRIDAVNHPNMDKEQISSIEVYNSLVEIFHSFKDRVDYLSCQKEVEPVSESPANQSSLGAPPTASSVDSSGEPSISTSITSLKAAKKLSRHTKQRLKAKKRFKVPPNTTETDEREESSAASPPTPLETLKVDRGISEKKRSKSMGKSKKKRHREGTGDKLVKAHSFSKMGSADIDRARSANERGFMVVIKNILRESLDSLLTTSDLYYRQKSQKNITRPEQVAESFEACAESLTQRLQSYHNQSDEYHKSCIKELHTQIISFLNCLQYVPEPVIKEILQRYRNDAQLSRANVREELHAKLQPLQAEKGDNESLLRPSLGHPQNIQELNELLTKEKRRQTEVIDLIKSIASTQKESEVYYASMFLEELSKFSSRTLLYFDEAYIPDDIITMDSGEVKKYNAIELMRHRLRAKPKTADEKSDKSNDEIDVGLLIATTCVFLNNFLHFPSTFTRKTSKAHKAVVVARDQAYKEYHQYFKKSIELIEKELETSLIKEERWAVCWEKSIKKMQDLYADYK
ncbi:uncharacterized protein TRIADDRAFT_53285 [Trichoplax adhaerens]|uniref:DUF4456 domain-containing protein n=1 Tax=Trichoplax adhaerens TaxID=10228 RepID=B3RNU0_TRIAD|nr:hypothetical protein TRIADDRAFT_53285 [Trichoplax adhaerens]EDV27523.1 hypothetical protein TRIADDRAFT_53285 [Trichoplax adhaerens]|eukprot:XP_002109357.1 hypothetical protein TRIADDRAFT_53285 [Trichoplax adhaerens]